MKDSENELVRLRAEKAALEQQVKEQQQLLTMLEDSLDGIWDWNILTGDDYLSPRWKRMLGYQPEELPNNVDTWVKLLHPDDVAIGYAAVNAHWEKGEPYEVVLRYHRKDGSVAWMLARGKAIRDDSGTWIRMAGTHTDLTPLKLAEQQILELNADLEQRVEQRTSELTTANKELESFAYTVSHDLRAPLRAIQGFSTLLEQIAGPKLEGLAQTYLQRIRANTMHMSQLIDDLLALSRVLRVSLRKESVDLTTLAHELVTELREREPDRVVEVVIEEGLVVHADPGLMRIALANLMENAWKFTSGRDQARIALGSEKPRDQGPASKDRVYFLEDNGVGFNMEYSDKLFGPFQRLHQDHEFSGNGIGLATVERIMRRHGGRVWGTGEVGAGATFYFQLESGP